MRVLHLGKFFPPFAGGIEHFMGDLLPALARIGVESFALVHDHHFGSRPAADREALSRVIRVPCYGTLLYAPLSPSFPCVLQRAMRRFAPDLLHLHLPNTSAFWALMLPGARRIPWVVHWHADVVASVVDKRLALAYGAYRPLEQALLLRSHAVIATSHAYLGSSAALKPWRSKSTVIPLGVDKERLPEPGPKDRQWAEARWGRAALRVLAVGRLTYYKGHDVLIRAAAAAGCPLRVLIVGEGAKAGAHRQQIGRLGVADQVALLGRLDAHRLQALMASCDCLCLPSVERTEAFGLVLPEAMRYGKPLVAADVPGSGMGWVVRHEQSGLLVRPGDHEALADTLDRLAKDPSLRKRLGDAAAQRFQAEFQIDRVAESIRRVYLELQDER